VRNFVEAKFFMGLRTGEAIGLRWPSVDLRSKHVMIVEGVVQGQQVDRTKTNTVRKVLLNSRALAALTGQKAHTYVADGHVFHDPRYAARWVGERAFGRFVWKPCLKRCKIRYREPYQTRHTYATMMLMSGMRPAFCAGQMGTASKSSTSTTPSGCLAPATTRDGQARADFQGDRDMKLIKPGRPTVVELALRAGFAPGWESDDPRLALFAHLVADACGQHCEYSEPGVGMHGCCVELFPEIVPSASPETNQGPVRP
jgi:hypothetical protein